MLGHLQANIMPVGVLSAGTTKASRKAGNERGAAAFPPAERHPGASSTLRVAPCVGPSLPLHNPCHSLCPQSREEVKPRQVSAALQPPEGTPLSGVHVRVCGCACVCVHVRVWVHVCLCVHM